MTLVEVAVATAILIAVLSLAYLLLASGSLASSDATVQCILDASAGRGVDEMVRELRMADAGTLSISPHLGSDRLDFRVLVSSEDGGSASSSVIEYRCERGADDTLRLMRVQDGERRTICCDVAPEGFAVRRTGDNLRIRLVLSRERERASPCRSEVHTSVTMRNRSSP